MIKTTTLWLCLGFVGQGMFAARFLVQWIASERKRVSHFPVAFWHLSIAGSLLSLVYALYLRDPPFILGQATGMIVYLRNLALLRRPGGGGPILGGGALSPSGGS
jgi:lipid-A-disaccharide synthase-like uncharacterized protein